MCWKYTLIQPTSMSSWQRQCDVLADVLFCRTRRRYRTLSWPMLWNRCGKSSDTMSCCLWLTPASRSPCSSCSIHQISWQLAAAMLEKTLFLITLIQPSASTSLTDTLTMLSSSSNPFGLTASTPWRSSLRSRCRLYLCVLFMLGSSGIGDGNVCMYLFIFC